MKKTSRFLFLIMSILIIFSLVSVMSACVDPKPGNEEEEDGDELVIDMLVKNGTFYSAKNSAGSTAYVKEVLSGWSKNSGASSYSDAKMGGIDLSKLNENRNALRENLAEIPGDKLYAPNTPIVDGKKQDTNAMVISSEKKGSVYYRTSSSVALEKNKYYKLTMDVYTDLINPTQEYSGVYIYVTDGVYAEFKCVDTNKQWATYEVYIKSNNFENRNVNIELWLGHGPNYLGSSDAANANPRLTQGFAMFDNIILSEYELTDVQAKEDYENATNGANVAKDDLAFSDRNFTYESKISSTTSSSTSSKAYYSAKSGSANNYNLIIGKQDINSEDRPSVTTGATATNGIFDMSKFYSYKADAENEADKYKDTFKSVNSDFIAPTRKDFMSDDGTLLGKATMSETEAILIFHRKISGAGFKSNQKLLIESNKYYKISVNAYVWKPEYPEVLNLPYPNLEVVEEPVKPEDDATAEIKAEYERKLTAFNEYKRKKEANEKKTSEYENDKEAYNNVKSRAHFKLTGASIKESEFIVYTSELSEGQTSTGWQDLTFYIQGNELSDRFVNLEFWFGEGTVGSETLMVGGAMFDDLTITESQSPIDGKGHSVLSPLEDVHTNFGKLLNPEQTENSVSLDNDSLYKFEFADESSSKDLANAKMISGKAANDDSLWGAKDGAIGNVEKPGTKTVGYGDSQTPTPFKVIMMQNKKYTATKITYGGKDSANYAEIMPNKFYRLSFWVKTANVDEKLGLNINILKRNSTDDITTKSVVTSIANINTKGEWQEVVFYLKGANFGDNKVTFEFEFGVGDIMTTGSHIKGYAFVSGIVFQNDISYTEFKNVSTGTYTKTHTFTSTTNTDSTVSNGNFVNTDYETTIKEDENAYDANGNLIGIGRPQDFSINSSINNLETPKNIKVVTEDNVKKLKWDAVDFAKKYYVYYDNFKDTDSKDIKNRLIAVVDGALEFSLNDKSYVSGYFKVQAVTNDKVAVNNNHGETKDVYFGVSALTSGIRNTYSVVTGGNIPADIKTNESKIDTKAGVIDHVNYSNENKDMYFGNQPLYPIATDEELTYTSIRSNNVLMLHSDYYTRMGYTMSSSSNLDAESYYEISVWVKTIGDATATITVNNQSNVFYDQSNVTNADDGNFVGYVNQSTGEKWVQYRFYAQTSVISATLKLELFLGNKYAKDYIEYYKEGETGYDADNLNKVKRTIKSGTSKGTIFFDDIYFAKLTEEDYNKKTSNKDDENKLMASDNYFNNSFKYKNLMYTIDSFDVFTEASEGSKNGATPKDYSHGRPTDGIDKEDSAVYGVFAAMDLDEDKHEYIYDNATLKQDTASWLGAKFGITELRDFMTGFGKNVLFMANYVDNGQYYKSNTKSINSESYYKISFYAKTLLPEGKNAEFRFEYGDSTDKYTTIQLNNKGRTATSNGFVYYEMYVYNERTTSVSSNKISFHLGTNFIDSDNKSNKDFFKGLMVIDNVAFEKVEKEDYDKAQKSYDGLSAEDKALSTSKLHKFKKTVDDENGSGDVEKPKFELDAQFWLLISTIIVGLSLVSVLVVFGIKKAKKKVAKSAKHQVKNLQIEKVTEDTKTGTKKIDVDDSEYKD